jgi:hypothetical protein
MLPGHPDLTKSRSFGWELGLPSARCRDFASSNFKMDAPAFTALGN